jgi:hypothetical protein
MTSVLYLGVEGILFSNHPSTPLLRHQFDKRPPQGLLVPVIITALREHPDVSIVLNSWWVADYGYRTTFCLLPGEIARKTIGATMPGNRKHRHAADVRTHLDILRSDITRRNPPRVTIVDAVRSAIPFEYMRRAVAVRGACSQTSTASLRNSDACSPQISHLNAHRYAANGVSDGNLPEL